MLTVAHVTPPQSTESVVWASFMLPVARTTVGSSRQEKTRGGVEGGASDGVVKTVKSKNINFFIFRGI